MLAVATLVADSQADTARLGLPNSLYFSRLRSGVWPGRIPTVAEAEADDWTVAELDFVRVGGANCQVGGVATPPTRYFSARRAQFLPPTRTS